MTPTKKRRNAWIAGLFIASPFLWAIPTFFYLRAETSAKNTACESNLRSFGAAFTAYDKENNRLPDAKNWTQALQEYKIESLHCPADSEKQRPSSYAMNANLSGKKLSDIKNPSEVILLYETTSKENTPSGTGKDLVDIGKDKAGQGRHNLVGYRFNYYVMADGTIRKAGTVDERKPLRWTP